MIAEKDIALRRLKDILLSEDQKRLAELEDELTSLQQQIDDKESLIETLDPVITDLLDRKIINSKDEFADILAPVIGSSIKKQVSEAKDDIVDALYPVIGKTIRKSVAEAMKNLVNSVNERIEKSLQSINIFSILKSKITGVSQGELVLRKSLPFRVEEMFVIRKEKGLLIARASATGDATTINEELVSGMFEAIKNFVATAFVRSPDQDLNEIEYGDYNIRLDVQNTFYTAAVIQGVMPGDFPDKLNALGHRIHNRFYKTIREFDGDPRPLEGCIAMLKTFMGSFQNLDKPANKSKPMLLYFLLFLFIAALAFIGIKWGPGYVADRQLENETRTVLDTNPSIKEDIAVSAKNGVVTLHGSVSLISQRTRLDSLVRTLDGVSGINNKIVVLKSQTELTNQINLALTPYRTSAENDIQFILEKDRVILQGVVPNPQTRQDISQVIGEIEGVRSVINNLSETREDDIERLDSFLHHNTIYFDPNQKELDATYGRILDYVAAKLLLTDATLKITGFSDNLSSPTYNESLSKERAAAVASYLLARQLPADNIQIQYYGEEYPIASNSTEAGRALNRRVELTLSGS